MRQNGIDEHQKLFILEEDYDEDMGYGLWAMDYECNQ